MAVESVTYINTLDPALPNGGDSIAEGDDHIRNVKKAIKNTFPNVDGTVELTTAEFAEIKSNLNSAASKSAIVASCKYNGTSVMYQEGVSSVTEVTNGNYRVIFDSAYPEFDQHYAPIVTPFRSASNRPVVVSLTGFSATQLDFSMTELPGDGSQIPSQGTGFSMLIVDMIQN
jgi:hypothetical protein